MKIKIGAETIDVPGFITMGVEVRPEFRCQFAVFLRQILTAQGMKVRGAVIAELREATNKSGLTDLFQSLEMMMGGIK